MSWILDAARRIYFRSMATMKEWDAKLKSAWTHVLGWTFLIAFIWGVLYAAGSAIDALQKHSAAPSAASAPNAIDAALAVPSQPKCTADHRFEKTEVYPIGLRADIAMDSCTGKLCKTWAWVAKDAKNTNSIWATYQELPVCSELPDIKP